MRKDKQGLQSGDPKKNLAPHHAKRLVEGSFIFLVCIALFIWLALFTELNQHNAFGPVGHVLASGLFFSLGYVAYLFPISLLYTGWMCLKENRKQGIVWPLFILRSLGLMFFLIGSCGLLSLSSTGGVFGQKCASAFTYLLQREGAILILTALLLVGLTWLTGLSWLQVMEWVGYMTTVSLKWTWTKSKEFYAWIRHDPPVKNVKAYPRKMQQPSKVQIEPLVAPQTSRVVKETYSAQMMSSKVKEAPLTQGLPSLSLLDKGEPGKPLGGYTLEELESLSREVEQHLLDFGIQADVVAVHPGPVITRFELQLAAGVKVSKLTALAKDLARSLSVTSVRVVEIIPGKTVVGIELPNQYRTVVRLSDVLSKDVYLDAPSPLALALGVDIAGHPMVVDLAKMPHLLVAGTTGSGKSVGINAMILSLILKSSPNEVRLILVDPKMLELSVYDGIPHLLTPVVTDMKEAASSLRWCVGEMERRYRLMAALGVRNINGYNAKVTVADNEGTPLLDPLWCANEREMEAPRLERLPFVVVIIDELADMMMVVGKKVEQLIARIAQKARAAGIHLILATQRPSVDVLTGLIKSNIPTRVSFQVSSKIDSRTILDQQGAEQLLGHGDMLFLAPGTGAPLRVHGAFVDDNEVHRVANDWRERGKPVYIEEITQIGIDSLEGSFGDENTMESETDPLYDQAVEFVAQSRKASVSALQRRFKVGYNRAARLIEDMERAQIVSPLDGGVRDVLIAPVMED